MNYPRGSRYPRGLFLRAGVALAVRAGERADAHVLALELGFADVAACEDCCRRTDCGFATIFCKIKVGIFYPHLHHAQ